MKQLSADELEFIKTASASWPPSAPHGRKIACPMCGATGYSGGTWIINHKKHTFAPCGKVSSSKGLKTHMVKCRACAAMI